MSHFRNLLLTTTLLVLVSSAMVNGYYQPQTDYSYGNQYSQSNYDYQSYPQCSYVPNNSNYHYENGYYYYYNDHCYVVHSDSYLQYDYPQNTHPQNTYPQYDYSY